jgi:hypothetical protein
MPADARQANMQQDRATLVSAHRDAVSSEVVRIALILPQRIGQEPLLRREEAAAERGASLPAGMRPIDVGEA